MNERQSAATRKRQLKHAGMTKKAKSRPIDFNSPEAIIHALNYHGAFFKKHVLKTILNQNLGLVSEEYPTTFGPHSRAADLVVKDVRQSPRGTELPYFIIECKRVSPEKQWVFIQDRDKLYRISRTHDMQVEVFASVVARNADHGIPICSDGYQYDSRPEDEMRGKGKRADSEAIYEAAKQISACCLGFAEGRIQQARRGSSERRSPPETYVPVLVTNAKLSYIKIDEIDFDTTTATLSKIPTVNRVPYLVYNFPFASVAGHNDFRVKVQNEELRLKEKESIYVVHVDAVRDFLSGDNSRFLQPLTQPPR